MDKEEIKASIYWIFKDNFRALLRVYIGSQLLFYGYMVAHYNFFALFPLNFHTYNFTQQMLCVVFMSSLGFMAAWVVCVTIEVTVFLLWYIFFKKDLKEGSPKKNNKNG